MIAWNFVKSRNPMEKSVFPCLHATVDGQNPAPVYLVKSIPHKVVKRMTCPLNLHGRHWKSRCPVTNCHLECLPKISLAIGLWICTSCGVSWFLFIPLLANACTSLDQSVMIAPMQAATMLYYFYRLPFHLYFSTTSEYKYLQLIVCGGLNPFKRYLRQESTGNKNPQVSGAWNLCSQNHLSPSSGKMFRLI